jgi:hypothetical protein
MSFLENDPSDFLTWRELMKMKLALFLFALGLGSSFAYAAETNGFSCENYCNRDYDYCLSVNTAEFCTPRYERCLGACGIALP